MKRSKSSKAKTDSVQDSEQVDDPTESNKDESAGPRPKKKLKAEASQSKGSVGESQERPEEAPSSRKKSKANTKKSQAEEVDSNDSKSHSKRQKSSKKSRRRSESKSDESGDRSKSKQLKKKKSQSNNSRTEEQSNDSKPKRSKKKKSQVSNKQDESASRSGGDQANMSKKSGPTVNDETEQSKADVPQNIEHESPVHPISNTVREDFGRHEEKIKMDVKSYDLITYVLDVFDAMRSRQKPFDFLPESYNTERESSGRLAEGSKVAKPADKKDHYQKPPKSVVVQADTKQTLSKPAEKIEFDVSSSIGVVNSSLEEEHRFSHDDLVNFAELNGLPRDTPESLANFVKCKLVGAMVEARVKLRDLSLVALYRLFSKVTPEGNVLRHNGTRVLELQYYPQFLQELDQILGPFEEIDAHIFSDLKRISIFEESSNIADDQFFFATYIRQVQK